MDTEINQPTVLRTREEIRQIVAEFGTSGMRQSEFCRTRGVSRSTLDRHLRKQRTQNQSNETSTWLLAVELRTAHKNLSSNGVELVVALKDVRADEAIKVAAGIVVVHGTTDEYYATLNDAGTQLALVHLKKPLAFFHGTYKVKVNNTLTAATVVPGITPDPDCAIVVEGTTDEYYGIFDSAGTQLASTHFGRLLCFVPGSYRAELNNSTLNIEVEAGRTAEYQSGSLRSKAAARIITLCLALLVHSGHRNKSTSRSRWSRESIQSSLVTTRGRPRSHRGNVVVNW